jgi:hypothetical protein
MGRDPNLVQVFFARGRVNGNLDELPELIPATFVKWSRAYLLDPEPGTYSVVAVTAAYAPPWNDYRIVGVSKTTWSGTSSDLIVFPPELIHQTSTKIRPGRVEFMGTLHVRRGERVDANTEFPDDLQRRIAQHIRPGVATQSGFSGWLERTRLVNLEQSSLSNDVADRASFYGEAPTDLGDSPWSAFVDRAAPRERETAGPSAPAPVPAPKSTLEKPEAVAATPPPLAREPKVATEEPQTVRTEPETASAERATAPAIPEAAFEEPESAPAIPVPAPEAVAADPAIPEAAVVALASAPTEAQPSPPSPKPRRFPGLPPDSLLSEIEYGMRHYDVKEILGPPDGRVDRLTAKAWIPFFMGPGGNLRDWIYEGRGRVTFSLYKGKLEVIDVVYDPNAVK